MPVADHLTPQQRLVRDVRRKALGAALAAARQKAGLTQDELAEASGVSRPTISRIEQGTGPIASDRLWDLAYACGTTPADLFSEAQATERDELGQDSAPNE
ncbi:helix-turn-helix domain-containing protein [Gordonia sp. 852002-51296_SCH5728562-b]|uniref:helix-turn-helix domain-containing protein n=1 Tax=Gordonia sp. 852002-51296_SCH5728562-b TaxID=1834101 RepID=UPI0007EAF04A|nr:helix-turn-helix transcriptional regulator [Gordonia sp. 852002-51296_SCH5728562-b]OBA38996.1 transcriptional regulator [Gordonia sp. 852002-51296_SCH5728562-b]